MGHDERMERARVSLEGLSIGDAFGQRFFEMDRNVYGSGRTPSELIRERRLPAPPWNYTDDSEMAIAICEVLGQHRSVNQDALAEAFARRFAAQPWRGYGPGAVELLERIAAGGSWRDLAPRMFRGQGSFGNGGAMRVAPVGAYFTDDPRRAAAEARASAEVTHAHPEGQAGAVAVAVAAAWSWRLGHGGDATGESVFDAVLPHVPTGVTREGVEHAAELDTRMDPRKAAAVLGSGQRVSSQDTVPFCLWCVARHPRNSVEAMWTTVSGLGDRDTTCAIVGGIVALSVGAQGIPQVWRESRERLPAV